MNQEARREVPFLPFDLVRRAKSSHKKRENGRHKNNVVLVVKWL